MNGAKLQHIDYQYLTKEKILKHLFFRNVFQKTDNRVSCSIKLKEPLPENCGMKAGQLKPGANAHIQNNPVKYCFRLINRYFTRIMVRGKQGNSQNFKSEYL